MAMNGIADSIGAGRKTQTIYIGGEGTSESSMAGNISVSARNLRKNDLGGMIFGCKHSTIAECLSKQLFGLPYGHISYVRNIGAGLPLFLFNYSDRKLHGIFEAASHGQLHLDAYAWTDGGAERTPFPAQVYIHMRMQCRPLTEDQFKEIIEDNYYTLQHFWFELDHAQARGLIALFKPSPPNSMLSSVLSSKKEHFPALTATKWKATANQESLNTMVGMLSPPALSKKENFPPLPAAKWKATTVNRAHLKNEARGTMKDLKQSANLVNGNKFAALHCDDGEFDCACSSESSSSVHEDMECKEPVSDWEDLAEDNVQNISSGVNPHVDELNYPPLKQQCGSKELESEEGRVLCMLERLDVDCKHPKSSSKDHNKENIVCENSVHVLNGCHIPKNEQSANVGPESEEERVLRVLKRLAADHEHSKSPSKDCAEENVAPCAPSVVRENVKHLDDPSVLTNEEYSTASGRYHENVKELDSTTSDINHGNSEVVQTIKELKEQTLNLEKQQVESEWELHQLRNLVSNAGRTIQLLKDRVKELELKIDPSIAVVNDSIDNFVEEYLGSEGVIYLVGGFNGQSWLSSLDSFSPSHDKLTDIGSMSSSRSFSSAVVLNDTLYAFGGGDGSLWFDTVECYNRRDDRWTSCPSMLQKKGSLAGAALNGKIFAIGGGDGIECFSDVEIFDPAVGKWINNEPMVHRRFAPAAAELYNGIYAFGGYDGNEYLRSGERFDPREGFWTEVPSMNTRRGCHALAVLNEKLYCMGGYDGQRTVSSVEIFDPRMNTWVMGQPMRFPRGYAAAAVLDNSLFVIGGIQDTNALVARVECYKERTGWITSDSRSIGTRCYCPAVVL